MRATLTFLTLLVAANSFAQVITRISNGVSHFYYMAPIGSATLGSVVQIAANNDTIILPGGIIGPPLGILIDRPLTILGAGIYPQTTGTPVTGMTSIPAVSGFSFNFSSTGSGSHIEGISFDNNVTFNGNVTNVTFQRCEFNTISIAPSGFPAGNGVTFKQCLFRSGLTAGSAQNLTIVNCVFSGFGIGMNITGPSNVTISQNVFIFPNTTSFSSGSSNSTWINNIFVIQNGTVFTLNHNGSFISNLFLFTGITTINYGTAGAYSNNQSAALGPLGCPANPNFECLTSATGFNINVDDLRLKQGGPADQFIGIGGYKAGIYGGPPGSPWKEYAIPFNPHWQQLLPVGNLGVTQGGAIGVTIQGAAQQN